MFVAHRAGQRLNGRIDEARRLAGLALDGSRERKERGYETQALRLLGEIAARDTPPDTALAQSRFREEQTLAEALEMRPVEARCRLGIGKLLLNAGRTREAGAELSTAVVMLRAMNMNFWLPEAEAALAQAVASPVRQNA